MLNRRWRYRLVMLGCILCIVAVGLGSKFYQGWGMAWVNHYGGDIVYEVFWIFLIALIWPQIAAWRIALGVLIATSIVEFLQLIPIPTALEQKLLWQLIFGTTFSGMDFPHYAIGCFLGWLALLPLQPLGQPHPSRSFIS